MIMIGYIRQGAFMMQYTERLMNMAKPAKHPHQEKPSNENITALLKKLRKDDQPAVIDT